MSLITAQQLVRRGHVEPAAVDRVEWLWEEIRRLKREKNAFIPAHNYQVPEIQAIADTVGDSFELAVRARDVQANLVVFCGVQVHGRGLLHAEPRGAGLPAQPAARSARWPRWTPTRSPSGRSSCARWAGSFSTMTYVNTYADVKALSDTCCTSSNAAKIAERLGAPDILFVPDQNLAYQVAIKTKRMYLPPPEPHQFHPKEYREQIEPLIREGERQGLVGNVFAWEGACHVHHQMTVEDIERIRPQDPEAVVIVHGEVKPELQRGGRRGAVHRRRWRSTWRPTPRRAARHPHRVRPGGAHGARAPREAVLQALPPLPVHEGQRPGERLRDAARRAARAADHGTGGRTGGRGARRCCG